MAESKDKKNSAGSNDRLSPKPPETVRKLLWVFKYGPRYWYLLIPAALFALGVFIVPKLDWFSKNSKNLPKTFNFVDFEDAKLRQAIEESTGLKFSMLDNVTYKITFKHTGSLRPAYHEGYYLFDGGVAVVLINETQCPPINEIKLQSWPDNPGNPKDILEAKIKKDLKQKIIAYRETVAKCLIKCLKNEK
jgi:hypothetical protein